MQTIKVGVRFQPLGNSEVNEESFTSKKHWVLVFSSDASKVAMTIELGPGDDDLIRTPILFYLKGRSYYHVAEYVGLWDDLVEVLRVHPQRGTKYSSCYNNCQHFVATYLCLLKAFAASKPKRSYTTTNHTRHVEVDEVLLNDGTKLYHNSNLVMAAIKFSPVPIGGAATGAAVVAAGQTVTTTVAAGGIAGWFGATTTVVAPAVYAGVAAACAPAAAVCATIGGIAYAINRSDWKKMTTYKHPHYHGFPIKWTPLLTERERSLDVGKAKWYSSASTSVCSGSTLVFGSLASASMPSVLGAMGATGVYKLASGVFV